MNLEEYDKILDEFSVGSLDYLFKTYNKNGSAVYATLFKLEKKNIINILLNKIEVKNKEPSEINESEKYIFDLIDDGRVKMKVNSLDELDKIFKKECKEKYLCYPDRITRKVNKIIWIILLIILMYLMMLPEMIDDSTIWSASIYLGVIMVLMFVSAIKPQLFEGEAFDIINTKVGRNVLKLLKILKKYLKKNNLEVKDTWENYKIYATILAAHDLRELDEEYGHLIEFENDRRKYLY